MKDGFCGKTKVSYERYIHVCLGNTVSLNWQGRISLYMYADYEHSYT